MTTSTKTSVSRRPRRYLRSVLPAAFVFSCRSVGALQTGTFSPSQQSSSPARLRQTTTTPSSSTPLPSFNEEMNDDSATGTMMYTTTTGTTPAAERKRSEALPWLDAPPLLDGWEGDAGFDPLRLAKTPGTLAFYREAEIKHCRLAMLAAVGWPLSEMLDQPLAQLCGLPCVLAHETFAPSFLNGGLGAIHPIFWGSALGSASAFELYAMYVMLFDDKERSTEPGGHLRFDPLGFYPTENSRRKRMRLAELKHGRTAMVAVVGYAAEEFILGTPVYQHSEAFFKPFWDYLW